MSPRCGSVLDCFPPQKSVSNNTDSMSRSEPDDSPTNTRDADKDIQGVNRLQNVHREVKGHDDQSVEDELKKECDGRHNIDHGGKKERQGSKQIRRCGVKA